MGSAAAFEKRTKGLGALLRPAVLGALAVFATACGDDGGTLPQAAFEGIQAVDEARITAAHDEPGNWLTHGRTYDEQRFSPLNAIDTENVDRLGLAWHYDFEIHGTQEATPLVVDGVLYVTSSWSIVHAIDAQTGTLIWRYDPGLRPDPDRSGPPPKLPPLCCGPVNRGVAAWKGRIYVGTLDARLVALDAATGKVAWERHTAEPESKYSITGAPRVVRGKVIIGNGGADYGVRGYVTAYDTETGELVWRFYTVPESASTETGDPALDMAAATWSNRGRWLKSGGGGTVWDSISYDAESNLLYIGVGNGAPLNRYWRDPGGGDNLFLASIVALDADTGAYVWHFQTTPREGWDFTATQQMILADLAIDGVQRQVLMQAPKNGFFYLLERKTGKFISAAPYARVTWASGVDPETGRPIESPAADYETASKMIQPGASGAHSWHSMAFSPQTGLVYLPVREDYNVFSNEKNRFVHPPDASLGEELKSSGRLSAWDPIAQKERWRVEHAGLVNGGVLATAGNLVFQGTTDGTFEAYRAVDGERLWRSFVQTGSVAAPITYAVGGIQYVAVLVGHRSALREVDGKSERVRTSRSMGRVLAFRLDGSDALPDLPIPEPPPEPPPSSASPAVIRQGHLFYSALCASCHGNDAVNFGPLPDLRYMSPQTHQEFAAIVLRGSRAAKGMPGFAGHLKGHQMEAIRAYVIQRTHETR